MGSAVPLNLNDPRIFAGYDPRSVERGIRYAAEGRVELIDMGDDWASGDVAGTRSTPYQVELDWRQTSRGISIKDDCTCPLGGSCKHAVALIVEIARSAPLTTPPSPRTQTTGPAQRAQDMLFSDPGRGRQPAHQPSRQPARPSWRTALHGIDEDDADSSVGLPMALQFAINAPAPTRSDASPAPQLTVRPLRLSKKGKWIKSGCTWREVTSGYAWDLQDVDETHLAALQALAAPCRDLSYSTGGGPVVMDRLGPGVWRGLRRAQEVGVALLDENGDPVVLSDVEARVAVDMTTMDDGAVSLTTGFALGDQTPPDSPPFTVGTPPHGLFTFSLRRLELIPLDRQVPAALAPLLGRAPLEVPADDVDEFLDYFHPNLSRVARVGSSDGSVTIATPVLDRFVAQIDHVAVDVAHLRWGVRYRRGQRSRVFPMRSFNTAGRDLDAEAALLADLELPTDLMADLVDHAGHPRDLRTHGSDTITLLTQVAPWLTERDQVDVEIRGDAPQLRKAEHDPLISLGVSDGAGSAGADAANTDWFDLSVQVSIDGEPVEFAQLFRALALDEPVLVLPSGTWMSLDRPELDRLRILIEEAQGLVDHDGEGAIRINPFQVDFWQELTSLGVVQSQSQRWVDNVERMQSLTAPEHVDPSPGLAATLRPYQQEGLDWLVFLQRNGLGGILADDMGLGKTLQTLAMFLDVLDRQPTARFLVVAPTSVVSNWHREADHFAPGVAVATISQTAARRGCDLATAIGDARVVVTSYALFRLEFEQYQALDWDALILDEAQFVKNHKGKTYQCVRRLDVATKLAITGTPIENSLMDLWSLLSIAAPGLYPDPKSFSTVYRKPIESGNAPELLATLRRRVAPLMRRRTKDEVLTELPPKVEQIIDVELSPKHARIYQTQLQRQRKKVLGLMGDVRKHRFEIFKSLTLLRQLSLDPGLVDDDDADVGSAKLDRLVEDLTQVVAEGHRALVFSTFTRYLSKVKTRLDDAGIDYAYLDGHTRKRQEAIDAFKDGDVPVFVISLKAGGFGLNLTEADYCFVLDPWWNPAAETQAVDRAHRIGQENTVVVYRYVSVGTIEEKVMELKARKAALFSSVMDADEALSGALGEDDIRALIDLG